MNGDGSIQLNHNVISYIGNHLTNKINDALIKCGFHR